jgi:uroporphyrin-3 C-methyltransferase
VNEAPKLDPADPAASAGPADPAAAADPLRPVEALVAPLPGAPLASPQGRVWVAVAVVLGMLSVACLTLVWSTQQRVKALEQELVKRQQQSQSEATEARLMAKQALDTTRDGEAKLALLEARVAETAMQRSQLEELIQQLSRSRDENLIADIEAALRVAVQQAALTGSAEPLAAVLKQSEERLSRVNQPRLDRVRRAVTHDLDRVKALVVADITTLTIKVDEVVRQVDDLPLMAQPERRLGSRDSASSAAVKAAVPASGASAPARDWPVLLRQGSQAVVAAVWDEVRALVRVTRIDHPEAALVAPEQAYFLRENLKLRLLNARLALMSRQFDVARSDLIDAQAVLERFFDTSSRRVGVAVELVRQAAAQSRLVGVPRPDESLAAIAAVQAGR